MARACAATSIAAQVTVLHRPGAGCYGHNSADDAAFDAAFVAMRTPNRTVRVQWTREDEFSAAPMGSAMVVGLRAVLDATFAPGRLDNRDLEPGPRPASGHERATRTCSAPKRCPMLRRLKPRSTTLRTTPVAARPATRQAIYDLPRHKLVHHLLPHVPVRTSSLRGLGAFANVFAIESFMDELAEIAGEDPVGLPALADVRSAWPAGDRDGSRDGRLVRHALRTTVAHAASALPATRTAPPMPPSWSRSRSTKKVRLSRVWAPSTPASSSIRTARANQIEGGIIQAASWTLKEGVASRTGGSPPTAGRATRSCASPRFRRSTSASSTTRQQPTLGLGEASVGPTAAAIGNAVARALGKRIRDLPLTRERIMATLLAEN